MKRLAETLCVGAAGGALFAWVQLPLPWMLGAMVATTVAALTGRTMHVPSRMRFVMIVVLGVLLGSTFTPDVAERASRWPVTLASLALYLAVVVGMLYVYFTRVMGYDRVTAYFSATPGGLTEMVITGAAFGGDDRTIALVHSSRVLLVVLAIPLWFRYTTGIVTVPSAIGPSVTEIALDDALVLTVCGVVGVLVGRLLRLPAYRLSGPLLVSGAAHLMGLSDAAPPHQLVALAQVVVGSAVGARFVGVELRRVMVTLGAGAGSTVLILVVTIVFALALERLTGIALYPLVLAFAPGGLTEMSLIALSLGVEVAFVATHHVARIALIVVGAPLAFRFLGGVKPPP